MDMVVTLHRQTNNIFCLCYSSAAKVLYNFVLSLPACRRLGAFFIVHGEYLLLAMLHKPAFDFFADVTDVVKEIDFLLSNKYLENEN